MVLLQQALIEIVRVRIRKLWIHDCWHWVPSQVLRVCQSRQKLVRALHQLRDAPSCRRMRVLHDLCKRTGIARAQGRGVRSSKKVSSKVFLRAPKPAAVKLVHSAIYSYRPAHPSTPYTTFPSTYTRMGYPNVARSAADRPQRDRLLSCSAAHVSDRR